MLTSPLLVAQRALGGLADEKTYPIFRKHFHIPTLWANNEDFATLSSHKYQRENHAETFKLIEQKLSALGYASDNLRMVHDYAHYLLCDLLTENNIPFITEIEISKSPALLQLLGNKTPDLIVKSDPPARPHPIILDVFVGTSELTKQEKRRKYGTFEVLLKFDVITLTNLSEPLTTILPPEDIKYFEDQVRIFLTEYTYWHACLKLKKILFNDVANVPIRPTTVPSAAFEEKKALFKENLESAYTSLENSKAKL